MFVSVQRFGSQVLGIVTRGVVALEGILEAKKVLNRAVDGALEEQKVFRPLIASVDTLASVVADLETTQREHGPSVDRLEALELGRIAWEAECEGLLLKADGKLRAANNAEARERQLKRSRDRQDPFDQDGEGTEAERAAIAEALAATRLPEPVPEEVPLTKKALAVRAKWGV